MGWQSHCPLCGTELKEYQHSAKICPYCHGNIAEYLNQNALIDINWLIVLPFKIIKWGFKGIVWCFKPNRLKWILRGLVYLLAFLYVLEKCTPTEHETRVKEANTVNTEKATQTSTTSTDNLKKTTTQTKTTENTKTTNTTAIQPKPVKSPTSTTVPVIANETETEPQQPAFSESQNEDSEPTINKKEERKLKREARKAEKQQRKEEKNNN